MSERLEFGRLDLVGLAALKAVAFKTALVSIVGAPPLYPQKSVASANVFQGRHFRSRAIILPPKKPAVQYSFCGAFAVASRIAPTEAIYSPREDDKKT